MKANTPLMFFVVGLHASWCIAAEESSSNSSPEVVAPASSDNQVIPPVPLTEPLTPPSELTTDLPGAPKQELSEGDFSTDLLPEIVEGVIAPDGLTTSAAPPLSSLSNDLTTVASMDVDPDSENIGNDGEVEDEAELVDSGDPAVASEGVGATPWAEVSGGYPVRAAGGFADGLPQAPSGFSMAPPGITMGGDDSFGGLLDGLRVDTMFSTTYNSNVNNSPGGTFGPIQDDFIMGLGGTVTYRSKAKDWTYGGSYNGRYDQYLEQTDYSGYNQGLGISGNYDGAKLSASLTAGIRYDQGVNRYFAAGLYSSSFIQQTSIDAALNVRYRLSPKTTLQGNIGQNFFFTEQSQYNDSESFNAGLAALWKYSKLTEFGPGVRFTYISSGTSNNRTSIGPELLMNYRLATKILLNSRIGVDFARFDNGVTADPTLTTSVGLNYNASKLWSMNLALFRGTQADASSEDVFTEIYTLRAGYVRKILRATLNLGVSYEMNSYQTAGGVAAVGYSDLDYFNVDSSLGMMLLSNALYGAIFLRYNEQTGNAANNWDSIQSGVSLNCRF